MTITWYGNPLDILIKEAIAFYEEKYPLLNAGRNRVVYELPSGKTVIKIPVNDYGIQDNYHEHKVYKAYGKSKDPRVPSYAKCWIRHWKDLPILRMEKVTIADNFKGLPSWIYDVDSMQVGYDSKGRLVAYDYGRF